MDDAGRWAGRRGAASGRRHNRQNKLEELEKKRERKGTGNDELLEGGKEREEGGVG